MPRHHAHTHTHIATTKAKTNWNHSHFQTHITSSISSTLSIQILCFIITTKLTLIRMPHQGWGLATVTEFHECSYKFSLVLVSFHTYLPTWPGLGMAAKQNKLSYLRINGREFWKQHVPFLVEEVTQHVSCRLIVWPFLCTRSLGRIMNQPHWWGWICKKFGTRKKMFILIFFHWSSLVSILAP